MLPKHAFAIYFMVLCLISCGGGSQGRSGASAEEPVAMLSAASGVGAIRQIRLDPLSVLSATPPSPLNAMLIVLSSRPNKCADYSGYNLYANEKTLLLYLTKVNAGHGPTAADTGIYTIFNAKNLTDRFASAYFLASGPDCDDLLESKEGSATAGTIQVTAVSDAGVRGQYHLTFGTNTLSGTFSAPTCAALNALLASTIDNPNTIQKDQVSCLS